MSLATPPAHVPKELIRDFDFMSVPAGGEDIYLAWQKYRNEPDFFWTPHYGGHWVATRFEDIEYMYRNYEQFSSRVQALPRDPVPFALPPIQLDPPVHTPFRKLLAPFFTPKAIGELGEKARKISIDLIDGFKDKGECEFVADFALHMPIGIFMSLVDVPAADRVKLITMAEQGVRGKTIEEQQQAFQFFFEYLAPVVAERKARPGKDAISAIANGTVDGRPLTDQEIYAMCSIVLFGGLDTVASMLGLFAKFLAEHPGHRKQLIDDPALIPDAVEELLRRHHLVNIARVAAKDFVYKGIEFKEGDAVLTPTPLAGLDERVYEDPLRVDFHRKGPPNLVFGRGAHQCIGSYLARTELKVFIEEWLARIPDFSIKPGCTADMRGGRVHTVAHLPLVWEVKR